jgi:uncharacterized membrane protein (UPF0136 family)
MLDALRFYFFAFGLFTIAGGTMGYVKAKSLPSLLAGGISGALLLFAGFLMGRDYMQVGAIGGMVVSVALAGRFIPSYLKTRKMMPAGLMAGLSVVAVILGALALVQLMSHPA